MTSEEQRLLRRAAHVLRGRVRHATPGPWLRAVDHEDARDSYPTNTIGFWDDEYAHVVALSCGIGADAEADARYVAMMHPLVASALADWLDLLAAESGMHYDLHMALRIAKLVLMRPPEAGTRAAGGGVRGHPGAAGGAAAGDRMAGVDGGDPGGGDGLAHPSGDRRSTVSRVPRTPEQIAAWAKTRDEIDRERIDAYEEAIALLDEVRDRLLRMRDQVEASIQARAKQVADRIGGDAR